MKIPICPGCGNTRVMASLWGAGTSADASAKAVAAIRTERIRTILLCGEARFKHPAFTGLPELGQMTRYPEVGRHDAGLGVILEPRCINPCLVPVSVKSVFLPERRHRPLASMWEGHVHEADAVLVRCNDWAMQRSI